MTESKVQKLWEDFLNPEVLRSNLIIASLYIAAFEFLKSTIVDRIRSFYVIGFDQNGLRIDPEYQTAVLLKNRSPVYASLEWLKKSQAIDDNDIAVFERVKKCRNGFAHAITGMLMSGLPSDLPARFSEMVSLLDKIERWWIVNVEITTDPQFDGQEIDEEGIIPGPIIGLRPMMDIALGSEEDSRKYLDEFMRRTRLATPPNAAV